MSIRALSRTNVRPMIWAAVIAGALAFFLWRDAAEVGTTVRAIREADAAWLVAMIGLAVAIQAGVIALTSILLRRLGHAIGWYQVTHALTQKTAIGTLSPLPGPGPFAFAAYLRSRGVPAADAILSLTLHSLIGYLSFCLLLVPVLALLVFEREASVLVLSGAAVLALVVIIFTAAVVLLLRPSGPPPRLIALLPTGLRGQLEDVRKHSLRAQDLGTAFCLSLLIDVAGAAMLGTAVLATGDSPGLATILAGYAVATLFTLVAPFFAGAGVVELGTVVVLRQLGVPTEQAVAATILFRVGELWLPFLFAVSLSVGSHGQVRDSSFRVPALVIFVTGLLGIASVIAPPTRHARALHEYSALGVPSLSRSLVLVSGFTLLYLSTQLWQRRRTAWVLACVVLAVAVPAHLLRAHDRAGAVVYAAALVLLLVHGKRFTVRAYVPSLRSEFAYVGAAVSGVFAYGIAGFYFLDERVFGREFTLIESVVRTLRTFALLGDPGLTPRTNYGHWFLDSLSLMAILAVAFTVYTFGRPVVTRRPGAHDRARAQAIISAHGDSSLDFFKYADDKRFFFGSDTTSVVAYGIYRATAVVLGDPVALDADGFTRLLHEFLAHCERNGWRVAFHQVPERHLSDYAAAKLKWMKIGEEAIVDLRTFTTSGGAMKSTRPTVHRLEREGYHVAYLDPPVDDEMIEMLRDISDEWLAIGHHRERQFTLGQFDDDYVRQHPVFVLMDAEGVAVAFTNVIPDGVEAEATIDLMRRKSKPDGAMDYLFVRGFEALRDRGYSRFSLGMAPFANIGREGETTLPEKVVAQLYEHGERLFAYKGLRSYKNKFGPEWEPRYLVYQSELTLPIVALALTRLTE